MPRGYQPPPNTAWEDSYLEIPPIEPEPDIEEEEDFSDEPEEEEDPYIAQQGCTCAACRPYGIGSYRIRQLEDERRYRDDYARRLAESRTCSECGIQRSYGIRTVQSGARVCNPCRTQNYTSCPTCDTWNQNGTPCPYCPPDCTSVTYGCSCGYCRRNATNGRQVQYWNYKPDPIFHGNGPLYLGMELEIGIDGEREEESADRALSELGTLGYLKEDGSIDGFELVTHPMSYEYAMSNFPWHLLSELDDLGGYTRNGYGLHVHVSRDGFSNPMHLYRWMKFFYRNSRSVELIARRRSNEWTNFSPNDRRNIKSLAKGMKSDNGRYQAINTQNDATLEIRVFRSSLDKTEVKAALALADASIEYTRNLTTQDILQKKGWSWPTFIDWAKDQNGLYLPLTSESDKLIRTGI